MPTLKETLDQHVAEAAGELYEKLDRNRLRCYSCGHCCPIADGQAGVCNKICLEYLAPDSSAANIVAREEPDEEDDEEDDSEEDDDKEDDDEGYSE